METKKEKKALDLGLKKMLKSVDDTGDKHKDVVVISHIKLSQYLMHLIRKKGSHISICPETIKVSYETPDLLGLSFVATKLEDVDGLAELKKEESMLLKELDRLRDQILFMGG